VPAGWGAAVSGLLVQNLDPFEDAQVTLGLYDQAGGPPSSVTRPDVPSGASAQLYLPVESILQDGAFAAIVDADRQIGAIARTDWGTNGAAAFVGHALPGLEVAVPLAAKGYHGQTTVVAVQNTDTTRPADVTLELVAGSGAPLATASKTIKPGTSVTVDLHEDAAFAALPEGTLGALLVRSADGPVTAQAFMFNERVPKAVYAYEGQPVDRAASRLYAPLVRNDFYGTTGISVVNPQDAAVEVTVTYLASPLTPVCAGQSKHAGRSFSVAARSSAVFYQGNVAGLPTGDSGLPKGCLGSAIIESTGGGVFAIVNDADLGKTAGSPGLGTSAAYNAFSDADGAMRIALPLYRKQHAGTMNLSTGIQAMNVGPAPAHLAIQFMDALGRALPAGDEGEQTLAPLASHTWYPPAIPSLPPGLYGSALITSDQPLLAVVNDASATGVIDAAIYSGVNADGP
jgi:hypothetical protein